MERVGASGQGFLQDAVTPDLFEADATRLVLVEIIGGDRPGAQGADACDRGRARASPSSSTTSQARTSRPNFAGAAVDPGPDRRSGVVVQQLQLGEDLSDPGG